MNMKNTIPFARRNCKGYFYAFLTELCNGIKLLKKAADVILLDNFANSSFFQNYWQNYVIMSL